MPGRPSLLFLPDISGFTQFVSTTEIEHSQHIISELLELLIDANELNMQLAEVEGDALFFYKHADIPSRQALIRQVEEMFIQFHNHLQRYEKQRICECGACRTASGLNLKFIVHAGELGFIRIGGREKPHGQEVIVAHRLMKNQVPIADYVLFSHALIELWEEDAAISLREVLEPADGVGEYKDLGSIPYRYFELTPLRAHVPPVQPGSLSDRVEHPLSVESYIQTPRDELFELISNFDYRLKWNNEVDRLEYQKGRVNRVGTVHACVINHRLVDFETVRADFGANKLVYGERTDSIPLVSESTQYFILEEEGRGTRLRIEMHPRPSQGWMRILYPLIRLFFGRQLRKSLGKIKAAAESPGT